MIAHDVHPVRLRDAATDKILVATTLPCFAVMGTFAGSSPSSPGT